MPTLKLFAACETCRRFHGNHGNDTTGVVVLCPACVQKLAEVLQQGYLANLNLMLSDLYDIRVQEQEGAEVNVFSALVLHQSSVPVAEVEGYTPTTEDISIALSFFNSRDIKTIAAVSIHTKFAASMPTDLLAAFISGDPSRQRDQARIAWGQCHHCQIEFPKWEGSRYRHGTGPNRRYFCSESCRTRYKTCAHCPEVFPNLQSARNQRPE